MNQQYATFYLGGLLLGVDVLKVQEVLRYQTMTPVPRASDDVAGLINLRGQIVTAVELRQRLGMPERSPDKLPMNVIVHSEEGPLSLLVDEIGDVLDVPLETLDPCPETMAEQASRFLSGIHKLDGALLAILDVDRLARTGATR